VGNDTALISAILDTVMGEPSMDFVGGMERERRMRKRVRSLPEITRDREKVKESLKLGEHAKEQGEAVAEVILAMETDPKAKEQVKKHISDSIRNTGIAEVFTGDVSPDQKQKLEQGKFNVTHSSDPNTHHDQLAAVPEGNVQEKIAVKPALVQQIASGLKKADS
jgi:hypothetical protein